MGKYSLSSCAGPLSEAGTPGSSGLTEMPALRPPTLREGCPERVTRPPGKVTAKHVGRPPLPLPSIAPRRCARAPPRGSGGNNTGEIIVWDAGSFAGGRRATRGRSVLLPSLQKTPGKLLAGATTALQTGVETRRVRTQARRRRQPRASRGRH